MEIWKPLPSDTRYDISNCGRIRRVRKHTWILKPETDRGGYKRISIGSPSRHKLMHALVAETFIGPRPNGMQINHKDGNKSNNTPENLEYVSSSTNNRHAYRVLGKQSQQGSKHGRSVLNETQVIAIHTMRMNGASLREVASVFDVSIHTVSMIGLRKIWRHLNLPQVIGPRK